MSITLTRYLIEEERAGRIYPDLRMLIEAVARACRSISVAVGKGALGGVLRDAGSAGEASTHIQGEAQKKRDVLSNEFLLEANAWVLGSRREVEQATRDHIEHDARTGSHA